MNESSMILSFSEMPLPARTNVRLRKLRHRFYALLVVTDFIAIFCGFSLAAYSRFGGFPTPFLLNATVLLCFIHAGIALRSLKPNVLVERQLGIKETLSSFAWALATLLVVAYALQTDIAYSRLWGSMGIGFSFCLLVSTRLLIGKQCHRFFGASAISRLVITDGFDINVPNGVTKFDTRGVGANLDLSHPIILDRISNFVCEHDEVIVACSESSRHIWANVLRGFNIPSHIIVPELASYGALGVERFSGIPMVLIATGYMDWRDRIVKRVFDLVVSCMLLILLSPVLVVIALAIKLDSPGPIFFVQQRVGRGNQLFKIIKFRSMRHNVADLAGSVSTERNDRRITKLGRFLRSTSFDELPQLVNVLKGQMSIVGPRPHAIGSLAGDKLFWEIDERYNSRHIYKPGLTGLAQIRGFRGATHCTSDLMKRLHADLEYTINWSLWRDIKIILSTVRVIIHPNAF